MSLFADEQRERSRKLDKAMDVIRDKFGADTIMRTGAMESGKKVGHKHKAQIEMGKENNS